jgi:3-oxoacyl-[acyl-carrier-protein] synthase-3
MWSWFMPESSTLPARAPVPQPDAPERRPRAAGIHSLALALPEGRLTSAELADRLGLEESWILSRTGVRQRPVARPDERLSDFAARAGSAALQQAGIDPARLDLVIAATMTQDELSPNTAPLVAHAIGATHAGAYDVGAACTAFLSGLSIGAAQIESGRADWVLVLGADFITRVVDWEDRRSAPLFGDAAGAVVLGPAGERGGRIGPVVLGSDGAGAQAIQIPHSDRKLRMDGPEVYRHALARMSEATFAALERAGLALEDVDLFVYHQANQRIIKALGERLEVDPARVVDCIADFGNSSAATIPLALAAARQDGRLRPGCRVLLGAFGAGFTWGGAVVEWGTAGA